MIDSFNLDRTIDIDIDEFKEFATEQLPSILIENTTDFGIAAFCLQAVHNEIARIESEE